MNLRPSSRAGARLKRLLAVSCLTLGAAVLDPTQAAGQPADLGGLMSLLGRVERVEADYRETVTSDLIATTISQRGMLIYQAPDRLERVDDGGNGFVLDGQQLNLINDGQVVRELNVADLPSLQALVGALRAIFAGDLETLRAAYELDYRALNEHWELDLEPIDTDLKMVLGRLHLVGTGATITRIDTTERNGDMRAMYMTLKRRRPAVLN
jgi:hypothetical protein